MDQRQRIVTCVAGEEPPAVVLRLRFAVDDATSVIGRVRVVMLLVSDAQELGWHADEIWRRKLPNWFMGGFEGKTLEELVRTPELWDFGSWLDAMRNPGWEWWSSEALGDTGVVKCCAHSQPYSIEPLCFLLRAAGANTVQFEEV